ncbi:hypothetical protein AVEN_18932-1 [Araneus ventricosus]|uniref:Uncharacterized protein n=1 Tax=Araneus ventricosus TaxID=182803 RepID=A0A4Y2QPK8_ARAVE|nr:hypothetical protein AVEN_18932-1 [Araneus ventricosus]
MTLKHLRLDIDNIRGQGYDNGASLEKHISGVQAQLLQKNSRAFIIPCAYRNYNLVWGDMAKTSRLAMTFFGTPCTFTVLMDPDAVTLVKKDVCIFNQTRNSQMRTEIFSEKGQFISSGTRTGNTQRSSNSTASIIDCCVYLI